MSNSLQAVLFDMDGLLLDSEPQWMAAETATVADLGGVWGRRQNLDLHGTNLEVASDYMIKFTGSELTRSEVMSILRRHFTAELARGVDFRPGAIELLTVLSGTDIAVGLVTSSVREHVDVVLAHLPRGVFDVTVSADDVALLKPHPMPYLNALAALDVAANCTVVLEDSPPGVAAAEAAGCHVVAVPSAAAIDEAPTRTVVSSLMELDLSRLEQLVLAG